MSKSNAERQKAYRERKRSTAPPEKVTKRRPDLPVETAEPRESGGVSARVYALEVTVALLRSYEGRLRAMEDWQASVNDKMVRRDVEVSPRGRWLQLGGQLRHREGTFAEQVELRALCAKYGPIPTEEPSA